MGRGLSNYKNNKLLTPPVISLDYLFGEGENMDAYRVISYSKTEPWIILSAGKMIGAIQKKDACWVNQIESSLPAEQIDAIGKFIDEQQFNFLPEKIKSHWRDAVQEVIMKSDESYLVICKADADFMRFKNVFSNYISQLVEDEWAVEFKVYNADFTDEFVVKVF